MILYLETISIDALMIPHCRKKFNYFVINAFFAYNIIEIAIGGSAAKAAFFEK